VSPLAGNWLVVGPMPTNQLEIPPPANQFSLAMTFDVSGNSIFGSGFVVAPCQVESSSPPIVFGTEVSFGTAATGTIAADGSFSIQTSGNPVGSISIQGKTPKASGGEWPGSYTASINPSIGPACMGSSSGPFTATSFPLIKGVYAGTGSVNGVTGKTTVEVTLQQGGTVVDQATGRSISSNTALVGSIRVQGISCFTSGVMSAYPQSGVEGNQVVATFTMDDGSTLRLIGTLTDATEIRMASFVEVIAGQCGKVPYIFQLTELDRQS
jgi:hypothetical protein